MPRPAIRRGYWMFLFGALVACSIKDGKPTSSDGASGGSDSSPIGSDAGTSGRNSAGGRRAMGGDAGTRSTPSEAGARDDAGASPAIPSGAGSDSLIGDAGPDDAGGPADSCDQDGGCPKQCASASATCAVIEFPVACEFGQSLGESATVACGESAVVFPANCGGCGDIAVRVYFDGKYCWQGMPDCTLPEFTGLYFLPHAPSR